MYTHTHGTHAAMTYLIGVDMFILFGVQNILLLDLGDRACNIGFKNLAVINGDHPIFEMFKAII